MSVLRREKNLGQLIDAFGRIHRNFPGATLLIVGSGPEEANLKAQAERLGINEACRFLPSTSDVTPALYSIDIFVHPSLTEGMPNAVMEAMACGCMVIATRVGGCPELITHGVHGLLANPDDPDDLLAQMQIAITDPLRRVAMAGAAAARAQAEFSIAASARTLEQIYERHLARSQRS